MGNYLKIVSKNFTFGLEQGKAIAYLKEMLWSVFDRQIDTSTITTGIRTVIETLSMNKAVNVVFTGIRIEDEKNQSAVYDSSAEESYAIYVGGHKVMDIQSLILPGFTPDSLNLSELENQPTAAAVSELIHRQCAKMKSDNGLLVNHDNGESISVQSFVFELEKFFISLQLEKSDNRLGVFAKEADGGLKMVVLASDDPEYCLAIELDCTLA